MRRRVALGLGGLPSLPAARGYGREFSVCNSEASQLTPQHDLTRALTVRAGHAYSPVMVERIETVLAGTGPWGCRWVGSGRWVEDQIAEQFAGGGFDDSDVEVVDEDQDAGSGVGSADADVVQAAGHAPT
jgi:hypothetical protein